MAKISLSKIATALDEYMSEWQQFLNIKTGEIVSLPDDPYLFDDKEEYDRLVEKIDETDDYKCLPTQYELNEYHIMMDFACEYPNETISKKLQDALHRSKPYRHFKEEINHFGIAERYYDYRFRAYTEIAREWCEYHNIEYDE